MAMNPMVGLWQLVEYVVRHADGRTVHPLGRDAVGYIHYSEDGFMSGLMMARDRPRFATGTRLSADAAEKVRAWDTCITYMGTYEFAGDRVIHRIKASLYPDWTGDTQPRLYQALPGGEVSLTAQIIEGGVQRDAIVTWRRIMPDRMN